MTTPQTGREAFEAWYAANDNTRKSIERDATGYRLILTESAWQAWDAAWQAALAQQDFPARFFASGPQGCAWFDDLFLATAMIAAFDKDDDWTITDTQDAPQQGRDVGEVWQVRVFPVAVNGEDDAHYVEMKRGVQSFRVGPDYWDTREEAEAYAGQLRIALAAPKQQAVEVTEDMVDRAMTAYIASRGTYSGEVPTDRDDMRAALLAALTQQAVDEVVDESPIYYMRDNHTFKRLSNSVSAALVEIEDEFNAGYTHGMLCSPRSGFKYIHANGNTSRVAFLAECRAALLAALPGKTEVDRDPRPL